MKEVAGRCIYRMSQTVRSVTLKILRKASDKVRVEKMPSGAS